jgi:hypothetical protein
MTVQTEESIFTRLAKGEFDAQLDQLGQAVRDRRKYVSQQKGLENKAALAAGDAVVITGGISPKYLIGVTGTVSQRAARRPGDVQVDIDEEYRSLTSRFGPSVGVPANCLAKRN